MAADRTPKCPTCGSGDVAVRLAGCRGQQWELDVDPWHFNLPGYPGHREAPRTDRTPADTPEPWQVLARELRRAGLAYDLSIEDAHDCLDALAAAGFRVVPEPDDTTRALADRLRLIANEMTYGRTASTHSEACWQWHESCALHRAADLLSGDGEEP